MNEQAAVADPAELVDPIRQRIMPVNLKQVVNRPGAINIAMVSGGHYPGCKLLEFEGETEGNTFISHVDKANAFFEKHTNLVVVDWRVTDGTLFILYTNQLEQEEIEVMNEMATMFREAIEKKKAEQQKVLDEQEADERKRTEELNELAKDGHKWRGYVNALKKLIVSKGGNPDHVDKEIGKMLQGPSAVKSLADNTKKKGGK